MNSPQQIGRTPREGIEILNRRAQISRARHQARKHGRLTATAKLALAGSAAVTALSWLLMIIVGILHADWWHAVPAMSYATAQLVTALLTAAGMVTGTAVTYIGRL